LGRGREEVLDRGREEAGAAVNLSRLAGLSREADRRETRSGEGEGDRVASLYLLRADPITLTRRFAPPSPAQRERLEKAPAQRATLP